MKGEPKSDDQMDIGWALLTLKLRYHKKLRGIITFHFENELDKTSLYYQVDFLPGYVDIKFGKTLAANIIVATTINSFRDMAFRGVDATELEENQRLSIEGDRKIWNCFLDSFGFKWH